MSHKNKAKVSGGHSTGTLVVEMPQEDGTMATSQVEEAIEVEETKVEAVVKVPTNVQIITGLLQRFSDQGAVLKLALEAKQEYKTREHGDKMLAKQIKDIYEMIGDGDKRFKEWKINPSTKLIEKKTQADLEAEKVDAAVGKVIKATA